MHNVLMCIDIIKIYRKVQSQPNYIMKLYLRRAYDIVEWNFIEEVTVALGFPPHFFQLVMTCLTTTQYSILINGVPTT